MLPISWKTISFDPLSLTGHIKGMIRFHGAFQLVHWFGIVIQGILDLINIPLVMVVHYAAMLLADPRNGVHYPTMLSTDLYAFILLLH